MIDFGLRAGLADEAKKLGWAEAGVVFGEGEILKGEIAGKGYRVCCTKKPEVARKNAADILALDLEDLVFDLVIAKANKYVELGLGPIIFGNSRIRALQNLQKALVICKKQKSKILVSTHASDSYGLRGMKDTESFLRAVGLTQEEVAGINKAGEELLEKLTDGKIGRGEI